MTIMAPEEVRWETSSNEWACAHVLFTGGISPGRVVDWGYRGHYPNIAVVLGDGSDDYPFYRISTDQSVEIAKRHLLAVCTPKPPEDIGVDEHECRQHNHWTEMSEAVLGFKPLAITIRKEWGVWNLMRGKIYGMTDLKFCPFCGTSLS